ncbi:MAG: hypothetical protein IJG33_02525 [Selenomonadaceae bacterium]|nr:hypothetical protein [Selenomonadaceae bacterium]
MAVLFIGVQVMNRAKDLPTIYNQHLSNFYGYLPKKTKGQVDSYIESKNNLHIRMDEIIVEIESLDELHFQGGMKRITADSENPILRCFTSVRQI